MAKSTEPVSVNGSALLQKAKECVDFLSLALPETGKHPGHTKDDRWRAWQKAVYDDPEFLYDGDFIAVYEECREKPAAELSLDQLRACITFLLRQMRSQYEPYPCLTDGAMRALLQQWINLTEEANG